MVGNGLGSYLIINQLMLHVYFPQIDKKSFKLLVGYVEGLQGAQRSKLVEEANTRVENYKPQQEEEKEGENKVLRYQYNRAVELLRVLA